MDSHLDWSAYEGGDDNFGFGFGFGESSGPPPTAGDGFAKAVGVCAGKRHCLSLDPGVMCPSYRVTQDERHSTRHRAETLAAALDGRLGEQPFAGSELAEALDLCVGCKGCKRECPNGVDMALLKTEARARRWAGTAAPPLRERLFARLPRLAPALSKWRGLLRLRDRLPGIAWLGEAALGLSARRTIPLPAKRSFLSAVSADRLGEGSAGEVVLLVDTFSNHFHPEIAHAALDVLVAGGYRVHLARSSVPGRPLCCGRSYLSGGLVEEAREEAGRTLAALLPYAARGLPVIGLEPSCLLMLRDEYHALGLGEAVAQVASVAMLLEEFLAREIDGGRLNLPLNAMDASEVLVHGHCHQKAFGLMPAMRKVLDRVPGLKADFIESSCCGMGGSFGYEAEHHDVSMAMAELDLLPAVRSAPAEVVIVANGTSCRQQIMEGAQRPALHMAQILQRALAIRVERAIER
ncbi:ferredoxin [Parazoarcus communis]|uniref:Ferredoxin n=1 Tax=Parazoarcus communis TaxID=41977 RepID=A0A2U8GQK7_9RHOO|nr:4Fe-4S dicluster domain-containing protein [Parazoarcus communis]AWI74785.1 ferredoxin [Parazoarcus communis]